MSQPVGIPYRNRIALKKEVLWLRAGIIQAVRSFFVERDYLEVDTPHVIPAPVPESHIHAVPAGSGYLHPSPELCMKRILSAGYTRIFQICRCFRGEERGERHLPEFTMLEWYRVGTDYRSLMEDSEALIVHIADRLGRGRALTFGGNNISLETPWERLPVAEAFLRYGRVAMERALSEDRFDEIMVNRFESHLGQKKPTFLYDYPASLASLSRLNPEDPSLAERFELFIGGVEIANGFSELTDAFEQRARFEKEMEESQQSGRPIYPMPEPFLEDLDDMPDAAGAAMGLDRLVMVFSDCRTIDDVVPFSPEDL